MKAKIKILLAALMLIIGSETKAQLIFITTPDTAICNGPITLNVQAVVGQLTQITADDIWSNLKPIGFTFNFFGNNYTQCVLSSNGIISFNAGYAGMGCPWFIPNAPVVPSAGLPINSIMGPWQDLYPPSNLGTIRYGTVGTAPNRKFVFEFCSMVYFLPSICPNMNFTGEVVLFETSNIIEVHILNKPFCPGWNGGKATEAIQNAAGNIGFVVPGRNASQWNANNDGQRFTPTGPASYNLTAIPYSPIAVVTQVQWFVGPTQVGSGNSLTVNPTVTTTYIAVGSIAGGCNAITTYMDTVTVTIVPGFNVTLTPVNVLCNGDATGSITAVPSGGGAPPFSYLWSSSPADTLNTLSNIVAATYTVTVTDSVGCWTSASVTITEPPPLVVTPDSIAVLCNGQATGTASVTVAGGVPGYTYQWSSGGTGPSEPNLIAGVYTVTITDANLCTKVVSINVVEPPLLTISPTASQTICLGSSVTLAANAAGGTPGYTYFWSPSGDLTPTSTVSPVVTTPYTVTVTDANGCQVTSSAIIITVNGPLSVSVAANPLAICVGESITISANGSGGDGNHTYTWTPMIGSTAGPFVVNPINTTTYTIVLTDGCGTPSVSSSVTVTVNQTPVVLFSATPTSGCAPLNTCFTDFTTISSGTINIWDWDFGDGTPHGSTQNPCHLYQVPNPTTGYTVILTVTSNGGCSASYTLPGPIYVNPITVASFSTVPKTTTLASPEIAFYDNSSGATMWYWTFGDGSTDTIPDPRHAYRDTGSFEVCLITSNIYSCSDTLCDSVTIKPDFAFYVPNAFTPNGDGLNEFFRPQGVSFKDYELTIYDRWGQVIFRSGDFDFAWDGNLSNGKQASNGVYIYTIDMKDLENVKHHFIGNVAVIR
ncbi:MAG TPA: PKD domain-containing protein [Bacteroidia bacterium]|nr:PKD domain-containing protein [Bacteroidia bacterium]